jgi:hypothetical protein
MIMAGDGWDSPRLNEDLYFDHIGGPAGYAVSTDGPVEYVSVASPRGVIGYLWASDPDDAVGWVARRAAGASGENGAEPWVLKLDELKAQGLTPLQALAFFTTWDGAGGRYGQVVPGSRRSLPSLEALKELAGQE